MAASVVVCLGGEAIVLCGILEVGILEGFGGRA